MPKSMCVRQLVAWCADRKRPCSWLLFSAAAYERLNWSWWLQAVCLSHISVWNRILLLSLDSLLSGWILDPCSGLLLPKKLGWFVIAVTFWLLCSVIAAACSLECRENRSRRQQVGGGCNGSRFCFMHMRKVFGYFIELTQDLIDCCSSFLYCLAAIWSD